MREPERPLQPPHHSWSRLRDEDEEYERQEQRKIDEEMFNQKEDR